MREGWMKEDAMAGDYGEQAEERERILAWLEAVVRVNFAGYR
jgi:hypothetical protein